MRIGARTICHGSRCLIVAELSANHNQRLDRALALVAAAADAGADAIKLQTYTADTLTLASDREWFKIPAPSPWAGKTLHELYTEAYTPWEWHPAIRNAARARGLGFFSTPFDPTAVEFLDQLGVDAYKVASFEIVDTPLLRIVAAKNKPVIASVGMAGLEEIGDAVNVLRRHGSGQIALLKCTSAYPAPLGAMNLRTIPDLAVRFSVLSGLSDHSSGHLAATAAVALGAVIVEKHLTLARADGGPDASFSMEPAEFATMVAAIRQTEMALGQISYERSEDERQNACFRRSLFVTNAVREGQIFGEGNVRSIRPGYGLPPRYLDAVIGKRASTDIAAGSPLTREMVVGLE